MIEFASFVLDKAGAEIPSMWVLDEWLRELKKDKVPFRGMVHINFMVAREYEMTPEEIRVNSRKPFYSHPRQAAMYIMTEFDHKQKDIAKFYDVHRTDVSYAKMRVEEKMRDNVIYRKNIENLVHKICYSD